MRKFIGFRCSLCQEEYRPDEVTYLCPKDGGNLNVILDIKKIRASMRPEAIRSVQEQSMWRYLALLPVDDPGHLSTPLRSVGWTPIYSSSRLKRDIGLENLWIKDESPNPTASFKDRASALLVARGAEIGAETIVTASTGNAGAALAGMAAAVGTQAVIFAPESAPSAKIAQLMIYGAQVFLVDGNYDEAVQLSRLAADEFGWYCRNTAYNPFTVEGKKTAAFEIWEQLLDQETLSEKLCIFVSVGDGNIISGMHKGFQDLVALGWLQASPRIFGVQAEGSAAIAKAFDAQNEQIAPVIADTLADSISVNLPSDGLRALRAATQTDGAYVTVRDEQIIQAIPALGSVGIFTEPAGAAAFAGAQAALESGMIKSSDPTLVIATGSGLKDVSAAQDSVDKPSVIKPTMQALKEALK
jgi:threonine synthase